MNRRDKRGDSKQTTVLFAFKFVMVKRSRNRCDFGSHIAVFLSVMMKRRGDGCDFSAFLTLVQQRIGSGGPIRFRDIFGLKH